MSRKNKDEMPLLFKGILALAGLLTGSVIMHFVLMIIPVNTSSMEPFIKKGDHILVNRISSLSKGDVAVYKSPSEESRFLISRVIGTEYDTIEIRDRTVYINNESLITPPAGKDGETFPMKFSFRDNMPPVKLGRGEYFMLSDNFNSSFDSRSFGPVNGESIAGRVIYKR